jgi:hypothetical protein
MARTSSNWEVAMRVRIDPNIRFGGNRTLAAFEDVQGFDAALLHIGEEVTVYEPEAGIRGMGSVAEVDTDRRLVVLNVDWESLRPEAAWAEWDAGIAAMREGAEERRLLPAKPDDLNELRARIRKLQAQQEAR